MTLNIFFITLTFLIAIAVFRFIHSYRYWIGYQLLELKQRLTHYDYQRSDHDPFFM